jgi:L-ribulose-5-phosphate 3-epimerase
MRTLLYLCLCVTLAFVACNNEKSTTQDSAGTDTSATAAAAQDIAKDWKFGVALWTFHTFNFPESLEKVDSAGLVYIEPNTFYKAGPALKDTVISQLSPAGIQKLRALIDQKGLKGIDLYCG